MPRYRIVKEIPNELQYRDGTLTFQDYYAGGKNWVWNVISKTGRTHSAKLLVAEGADGLEAARRNGIDVEKGSTAELIFASLVRKGFAERVPD